MKVLILGAAGQIARYLTIMLLEQTDANSFCMQGMHPGAYLSQTPGGKPSWMEILPMR